MTFATLVTRVSVTLMCATGFGWTCVNLRNAYENTHRPLTAAAMTVPDWQSYARAGQRIGSDSAAVTVVVFSDYQCEFCAAADRTMKALLKKYPSALAEVIRHYPLPGHPAAVEAARAAACASFDGHFTALNDQLFAGADSLGTKPWTSYALAAGLSDTAAFRACLGSDRAAAVVAADLATGRALKIARTPTLLVNEKMYEGLPGDLEKIVGRQVSENRRQPR